MTLPFRNRKDGSNNKINTTDLNIKLRTKVFIIWATALLLLLLALYIIKTESFFFEEKQQSALPNIAMIAEAEKLVKITTIPAFEYSFDLMTEGVLQHLDREYTYDVVPEELQGGFLFQGIHRPPKGTVVIMDILEPTTVSFFFHSIVDGGYSQIFENLDGWKKASPAPQYDILNGDHGLDMTIYQFNAHRGNYSIPATTEDRACFSIVFQKK
jgi:hypothetical protein